MGYNFKNDNYEVGEYAFLNDKKIYLAMDLGSSPDKKFSEDYQAGALSFEIVSNGRKIVTNSGYFQKHKHQLNLISKSTACHSTLVLNNSSSTQFVKMRDGTTQLSSSIKVYNKNIKIKKDYWNISADHDGYAKRFGAIHSRKIEFIRELKKFSGIDTIKKKNAKKELNFEIRFHLDPEAKIMRTQDKKTIYVDYGNESWKFKSTEYNIDVETGLFFGEKNNFLENHNIVISGLIKNENEKIIWEIEKMI